MRILLIRHGEPDYKHDSLTPKGFLEAEQLAERMVRERPDAIYVSPLGRAQATVQPTLRRLGMQAETLPWLEEFNAPIPDPQTGEPRIPWDFMPRDWTHEDGLFHRDTWQNHRWMAASPVRERYQWVTKSFDELLARYGFIRDGYLYRNRQTPDITIALFCHFAVSMVMLSHLTGVAAPIMWHGFFMPPTSITMLCGEERTPHEVYFRAAQVGDTSHLYAAGMPISTSGLLGYKTKE